MSQGEVFVPPHSVEAECALLGAMMQWPDAQDHIGKLRAQDFFRTQHREIFEAITELNRIGRSADMVSVFEHMRESGVDADLTTLVGMTNSVAGKAGVTRHAEIIRERALRRGLLAHCAAVNEEAYSGLPTDQVLAAAEASLTSLTEGRATRDPISADDLMQTQLAEIDERCRARQEGRSLAWSTGFRDLDVQLGGGFRPGELVILAGRPAMGKSALAYAIALASARAGQPALACSQEMANTQNGDRLLSMESGVPLQSLRTGDVADNQWSAITAASQRLSALPIYLDDQTALRIDDVRAKARLIKRRHGLCVLVVDYLQLMVGQGDNRVQEVGSLSRGLKRLAGELGICIVALSQLNRGLESRVDKRPIMADLRESGDIEADADIIIMLYRDEVYNPDTYEKGVAEAIVRKQRGGAQGTVFMTFMGERTLFANVARDWRPATRSQDEKPRERGFGGSGE